MEYPAPVSDREIEELAAWHRQCLPGSALSWLGEGYLRSFYRHVRASGEAALVVRRSQDEIVAAAVIAWRPEAFLTRLVLHTAFIPYLVLRAPSVVAAMMRNRQAQKDRTEAATASAGDILQAPELVHFYTVPSQRNRGVGTALLDDCERLLHSRGEPRYWLRTEAGTGNRALVFYRRNGFQPVGSIRSSAGTYAVLLKQLSGAKR